MLKISHLWRNDFIHAKIKILNIAVQLLVLTSVIEITSATIECVASSLIDRLLTIVGIYTEKI